MKEEDYFIKVRKVDIDGLIHFNYPLRLYLYLKRHAWGDKTSSGSYLLEPEQPVKVGLGEWATSWRILAKDMRLHRKTLVKAAEKLVELKAIEFQTFRNGVIFRLLDQPLKFDFSLKPMADSTIDPICFDAIKNSQNVPGGTNKHSQNVPELNVPGGTHDVPGGTYISDGGTRREGRWYTAEGLVVHGGAFLEAQNVPLNKIEESDKSDREKDRANNACARAPAPKEQSTAKATGTTNCSLSSGQGQITKTQEGKYPPPVDLDSIQGNDTTAQVYGQRRAPTAPVDDRLDDYWSTDFDISDRHHPRCRVGWRKLAFDWHDAVSRKGTLQYNPNQYPFYTFPRTLKEMIKSDILTEGELIGMFENVISGNSYYMRRLAKISRWRDPSVLEAFSNALEDYRKLVAKRKVTATPEPPKNGIKLSEEDAKRLYYEASFYDRDITDDMREAQQFYGFSGIKLMQAGTKARENSRSQ